MGAASMSIGRLLRCATRAAVVAFACALFTGPPVAAQPAPVETGSLDVRIDNGFARLVFTFTNRPRHTVTSNSGVLVLRFDRPVDVPLSALGQKLPTIIPSFRTDSDKKAIRLALNRKFRINTSEAGEQLFLDLLPEPWKGALPALPPEVLAELARQAEEAERLKREAAERYHRQAIKGPVTINESEAPTFSRLEFVWPAKPTAVIKRNDNETELAFDAIGIFEEGKVRARLPRFIDDIHISEADNRSLVKLTIDAKRDVRSFIEGNTFVLDVIGPEKSGLPDQLAGIATPAAGGAAVTRLQGVLAEEPRVEAVRAAPAPAAAPDPAPASPAPAETPSAQPLSAASRSGDNVDAAVTARPEPAKAKAGAPSPRSSVSTPRPRPLEAPQRPPAAVPTETAASVGVGTPVGPAALPADGLRADGAPSPKGEPVTLQLPAEPQVKTEGSGVVITSEYQNGLAKIEFVFPKPVAAAAFFRGSTLWLVFDTTLALDVEPAIANARRVIRGVDVEEREGRQIIRLRIDDANLVSAQADGTAWRIFVGDAPPHSAVGLDVKPRYTADGRAALHVEAKHARAFLRLADPVVGDIITIVPLPGPAAEIAKTQHFVDADILRTVHGVAIKENVDDLTVRVEAEAIIVEREAGLALSSLASTRAYADGAGAVPELRQGFVDFAGWKLGPVDRFSALRQQLIRRAASSEGAERTSARLDLARFYLAHMLAPEALSLLGYAAADDALIERDKSFRILRGVSAVLARRFDIAERDLNEPEFDDNPDVALWRGLAAAENSDRGKARRFIRTAHPVLDQYPRPLQKRALLALAEAQIELGDISGFEVLLDEIAGLDKSPASGAHLALLRGRYSEMLGRVDQALGEYQEAARQGATRTEAEATLRYTELASKIDRMPRTQAVENLVRVNFSWRGDAIELKARQLLARFAIERGDYRDAFTIMRGASSAAPAHAITQAIQDEAKEAFAALFLDEKAAQVSAVERLALFYDFQDLVPSGRRGDEMIRKLAGRLVDVDLLDQSIDLLTHQVDKRLVGAARAEVAGQLAFIHLLNREPEKALAVLRRTRQAQLSNDLERQRNLIEARALAAVGRGKLAVELLSGEDVSEFKRLKADLLWESKEYGEAGAAIEDALGNAWTAGEALNELQRAEVLRAAVAQALAGDQASIDRLRQRYSKLMAGTSDAVTFNVLTGRIESQGTEFRQIARNVASVNTLENFLKEYRDRYRPGGRAGAAEPRADATPAPPRG